MLDAAPPARLDPDQQGLAHDFDAAPAPSGSRPAWCCVATYSQAERRAYAALHRFGFTAYLPLVTIRRPNRHYHTGPLFPGYLFVRLHLDRPWSPVVNAPGVFSLLSFDGRPATCSDAVIASLRATVDAAEAFSAASPLWKPGTPCTLSVGPLAGMPAVVTKVSREPALWKPGIPRDMATVAVMMFGALREVSVSLDCLTRRDE